MRITRIPFNQFFYVVMEIFLVFTLLASLFSTLISQALAYRIEIDSIAPGTPDYISGTAFEKDGSTAIETDTGLGTGKFGETGSAFASGNLRSGELKVKVTASTPAGARNDGFGLSSVIISEDLTFHLEPRITSATIGFSMSVEGSKSCIKSNSRCVTNAIISLGSVSDSALNRPLPNLLSGTVTVVDGEALSFEAFLSANTYGEGVVDLNTIVSLDLPAGVTFTSESGVSLGQKPSNPLPSSNTSTSSDLDGNGTSDVIWRNSGNGATALWLMNGTAIGSFGFPGGVPLIWQIAGVGDVNGDGKADVIWRHGTSGTVAVWVMNGVTITSVGFPGSAPTNWSIQGVGDVNGDGKADLVWRNTADGNTAIWVMNGTTVAASSFPGVVSESWQIAGVGDVNGDGKADVIWRNGTSGAVAVWVMNGAAIGSIGFPGSASTDFKIAGIGDVNGDGKVDLVWHNSSDGNMEIWLLNGKSIASTGTVDGKILVWKIAKVGDVNGDGKADVIWRNGNTGELEVWLLNGISITSTGSPGAPSPNWELQGSPD